MKLQDYAHYYIGAPCFNTWFTPDHDAYDAGWKLSGIRTDNEKCYMLENETDVTWVDSIALKLRRLEDMTREDMKAIWQIIFNRPFHKNGSIVWIDKEDNGCAKRFVMSSGVERVGIEINGNVWADSDLHHYKFSPTIIFHYLLQQGFDLFGLIPAGLAIDIKTITQ